MTTTGKSQDARYRFLLSTFICYVPLTAGLCSSNREASLDSATRAKRSSV